MTLVQYPGGQWTTPKSRMSANIVQITVMLFLLLWCVNQVRAQSRQEKPYNPAKTEEEKPIPSPSLAQTYPYQPTSLDTLISGPYTKENKLLQASLLLPGLAFEQSGFAPLSRATLVTQTFLKQQLKTNLAPSENYYINFCLFRAECDRQRIREQDKIITRYKQYGYSTTEAYSLHQGLSYKIRTKYGLPHNTIVLLTPERYHILQEKATYYGIDMVYLLRTYLSDGEQSEDEEGERQQPHAEWYPDSKTFRKDIREETMLFGDKKIPVRSYPRSLAYAFLQKHGIMLWSSSLREKENGSSIEYSRTGLEGIHQETLDGLVVLIQAVKQETNRSGPYHLIINGGTEKGHSLGNKILAGMIKPGYSAPLGAVKAHGSGWTVDIRLAGQELVAMKEVLPGKKGKTEITAADGRKYVVIYLYHGTKSEYHLHASVYSYDIYGEYLQGVSY